MQYTIMPNHVHLLVRVFGIREAARYGCGNTELRILFEAIYRSKLWAAAVADALL